MTLYHNFSFSHSFETQYSQTDVRIWKTILHHNLNPYNLNALILEIQVYLQ